MTDRDALLKAVDLLRNIERVAGGFVSRSQREKIAELEEYTRPYGEARMLDNGWYRAPDGTLRKEWAAV